MTTPQARDALWKAIFALIPAQHELSAPGLAVLHEVIDAFAAAVRAEAPPPLEDVAREAIAELRKSNAKMRAFITGTVSATNATVAALKEETP